MLIYYAIANAAAYSLPASGEKRRRVLNVCGLAGCLLLVAMLPWQSVLAGLGVFAVGIAGRFLVRVSSAR